MSKRETIDLIRQFNPTAQAEFLASFEQSELNAYLHQLQELERDRQEHLYCELAEPLALAMC